jgi:hypothetical protein
MLRTALAVMALSFTVSAAAADVTEWWGRKLPDAPSQFIFGYGSLINTESRNSTATKPIAAIPVRVSRAFGYVRAWNDRSITGFTALGLRRPRPGESAGTINGVVYPVDGDDMTRFDAREAGYARVEIPHDAIEAVSWQRLPEFGHIWVYVPVRPDHLPGEDLPGPDVAYPLLESYIDVVIEGGLEYGPDYAREIIETTADWSRYWLNDRELGRRPWVHDARSSAIDKLLAETPAATSFFSERLFSGPFAVHWLVQPAK